MDAIAESRWAARMESVMPVMPSVGCQRHLQEEMRMNFNTRVWQTVVVDLQ